MEENELTKRQKIALAMLVGEPAVIRCQEDERTAFICDALDFADMFIDISEDETK